MRISVIVPCYNEEAVLPRFWQEILKVTNGVLSSNDNVDEFEFLFVNDGSSDGTLRLLRSFAEQDERARYLSFSRNFGKEAAILAGLKHCSGDYIAIMDADLQDPPSLLPQMIEILDSGEFDSVATRRVSRKGEPIIRSFFARAFYKIINRISDADIVDGARDFRLMTRQMVDAVISMGEYNRFSKGIFGWVGFRTKWLPYENVARAAGETKWSFWKLVLYSMEGITAFSTAPLAIASVLGIILCMVAFFFICAVFVKTLMFGDPVGGWPSTMCVILFMGGIQLFCIGIVGQYLAKTYLETKHRPVYIVQESSENRSEGRSRQ